MVTEQKDDLIALKKLKQAIQEKDKKKHALYRSVFLRNDVKQNLLETELILAIDEAELTYLDLKKEDSTDTKAKIEKAKKQIVKFKAELKVQEANVRKLKQNVRMIVIWTVVIVLIFGCLGWGCWFINKKEDYMLPDQTKVEGGESDDLYHKFIDNEIS